MVFFAVRTILLSSASALTGDPTAFPPLPVIAVAYPQRSGALFDVSSFVELQDRIQNAVAGDWIRVAPGTYVGDLDIESSGSETEPVVIFATSFDTVTLRSNITLDCSHVRLANLVIEGTVRIGNTKDTPRRGNDCYLTACEVDARGNNVSCVEHNAGVRPVIEYCSLRRYGQYGFVSRPQLGLAQRPVLDHTRIREAVSQSGVDPLTTTQYHAILLGEGQINSVIDLNAHIHACHLDTALGMHMLETRSSENLVEYLGTGVVSGRSRFPSIAFKQGSNNRISRSLLDGCDLEVGGFRPKVENCDLRSSPNGVYVKVGVVENLLAPVEAGWSRAEETDISNCFGDVYVGENRDTVGGKNALNTTIRNHDGDVFDENNQQGGAGLASNTTQSASSTIPIGDPIPATLDDTGPKTYPLIITPGLAVTNPDLPAPTRTINVPGDMTLNEAIAMVQPGDHVFLADGTYSGSKVMSRSGTAERPIVWRAENAHLADVTSPWDMAGDHNILYQLDIRGNGSFPGINGNGVKIWRCRLRDNQKLSRHIPVTGSGFDFRYNAIDNVRGTVVMFRPQHGGLNGTIARNHFTDCDGDGYAPIALGVSGFDSYIGGRGGYLAANLVCEFNLFERCSGDADAGTDNREMVMVKANNVTLRGNTLLDSIGRSYMDVRYGHNCLCEMNWIEDSTGLFFFDRGHVVRYNKLVNTDDGIRVFGGTARSEDMLAIKNSTGKWQHPVGEHIILAANESTEPLRVGDEGASGTILSTNNITVEAHVGTIVFDEWHDPTTYTQRAITDQPGTIAVKLSSTDVGLAFGL